MLKLQTLGLLLPHLYRLRYTSPAKSAFQPRFEMIIHQLCTSLSGGASAAAQRLHRSLRTAGVDSRFWFASAKESERSSECMWPIAWPKPPDLVSRLSARMNWYGRKLRWNLAKWRHLRHRPKGYEIFTPARLANDTH